MSTQPDPLLGLLDAGQVREHEQRLRRHVLGHENHAPNRVPAVANQETQIAVWDAVKHDGLSRFVQSTHFRFVDWLTRQRFGTHVLDYRLRLDGTRLVMTMRAVQLLVGRWLHRERRTEYLSLGVASLQASRPLFEGEPLMVYVDVETGRLWARPEREFRDGRFTEVS